MGISVLKWWQINKLSSHSLMDKTAAFEAVIPGSSPGASAKSGS